MNRRRLMLGLLVLPYVAIGCNINTGPDTVCDANPTAPCISLSKFSTNISNALNGRVVGYVSIVGSLQPVFGGQARTSADSPSMAMLPDMLINVASVSKTLTAIAVLQSLARHNLTIDHPIWPYLWPSWRLGPNINRITFRDLLTHRSGFRANCDGSNTTYSIPQQQIAAGVNSADMAVASYNNCNFAIFREMLPFMEGNIYWELLGPPDQWSATLYLNYMNQHVFAPVGIRTRECKPSSTAVFQALSYQFPPGSTRGADWGDWTLACGGGGWVLSAGDLYKVVNDLATSNALLTNDEKALMGSNCLGWDCSVRTDCPGPYVCKNGGLDGGSSNIHLRTYIGIFKCNVPVVVIVNSDTPADEDPIDVVAGAYNGAAVSGSPAPCQVPGVRQSG